MFYKIKTNLFILLLLWVSSSMMAQTQVTGFYPEKNKLTIAPNYCYKNYNKFYRGETLTDGNPGAIGGSPVSSYIINFYGEYGITNWLSSSISLPYISIKTDNGDLDPVQKKSSIKGIQDLSVFLKAKIIEEKLGSVKVTLGAATGVTVPIGDYEGLGIITLGNRATTYNGDLIAQFTFANNFFTELQGGYSLRENKDYEVPEAVVYGLKLGYFNDIFYLHAQIASQNSLDGFDIGSPEFGAAGGPLSLPQTKVNYTNLNFNIYFPLYKDTIGISSAFSKTIDGRNFGRETSYAIGLVYKPL